MTAVETAAVEWQDARRAFQKLMRETKGLPDDVERAKASDRIRDAVRNLDDALDRRP